jgi:hypothetical protein
MKTAFFSRSGAIALAILLIAALLFSAHWAVAAPLAGEAIDWWVHGGGGAPSGGGDIALNDTLGQPIIGDSSSGEVGLGAGYWAGALRPTGVTLARFEAAGNVGWVQIAWVTAQEVDLLGFNLYRGATPDAAPAGEGAEPSSSGPGEAWTRLNPALIPAQAGGSPFGASYSFADESLPPGETGYYWLEVVSRDGAQLYGPQAAMAGYGFYLPLISVP